MNVLGKKEDLKLYNKEGLLIYEYIQFDDAFDIWDKYIYNDKGNRTSYENSNGYWTKYTYNDNGQITSYENSNGYWYKTTYDDNGEQISWEGSDGIKKTY